MEQIRTFCRAIFAGVAISLGGMCFLSIENRVIGALFFTVGLFLVCTRGYDLYTGKVCYARAGRDFLRLPVILAGNLAGTALMGGVLQLTRAADAWMQKAQGLMQIKTEDGLLSLFLLGIFCNIFIFIAVDGYRSAAEGAAKYLSLFFGVGGFILCGTEHIVADLFYFFLSGTFSVRAVICLLAVLAGNTVGGLGYSLLEQAVKKERPASPEQKQ